MGEKRSCTITVQDYQCLYLLLYKSDRRKKQKKKKKKKKPQLLVYLSRGVYCVPTLRIRPTEWEVSFWISQERRGKGVFAIAFCLCTALLLASLLLRPSPLNLPYHPLSFRAKTLNRSSFPTCWRSGSREIFFIIIIPIKTGKYVNIAANSRLAFFCQNCYFLSNTPKQLQMPHTKYARANKTPFDEFVSCKQDSMN